MRGAFLDARGALLVSGPEAGRFLDNLLTNDVGKLAAGRAAYAALLTPQGKIIVDMLASRTPEGGFLLDLPRHHVADVARRLTLYRLRSKVEIEDVTARTRALVIWGDGLLPREPKMVIDPRIPGLGARAYVAPDENMPDGVHEVGLEAYRAHRIALGAPQGGLDFVYGEAFPHEACLDQLNGIDFKKGCYVGQEVVSRMEHRGTARTRVVPVLINGLPPEIGAAVTAGERVVGRMGSSVDGRGLALVRLDRAAEARAAGQPLIAGAAMLTVEMAAWARFAWPGETAA
ncbi:folate-binding protein YgfZ [Methylopila sp. M107]|uniref:CAF17-like 4Fe-4S cluster assembly/insertion protein YgfZ n=1 Tax=Methylopila sp. M107 TaxID=1101190 RepID=UPI0003747E5C|nr:folate-binding protein YgfZ [Methylopila sp. M107]